MISCQAGCAVGKRYILAIPLRFLSFSLCIEIRETHWHSYSSSSPFAFALYTVTYMGNITIAVISIIYCCFCVSVFLSFFLSFFLFLSFLFFLFFSFSCTVAGLVHVWWDPRLTLVRPSFFLHAFNYILCQQDLVFSQIYHWDWYCARRILSKAGSRIVTIWRQPHKHRDFRNLLYWFAFVIKHKGRTILVQDIDNVLS